MKVDKEFLETLLKEPVRSFTLSAGTKPGDNIIGVLESINVSLESGGNVHLVNKTIPEDPEFRDFCINSEYFLIEQTMYDTVGPRIESLLRSKGIKSDDQAQLPFPRYFGADSAKSTGFDQYICLEDVRIQGYIMQDKYKGFGLQEMTLVLQELAKLHASSYFWIKYEGEKIFQESHGLKKLLDSHFTSPDPIMIHAGKEMFWCYLKNAESILREVGHIELADAIQNKLIPEGQSLPIDLMKKRHFRTDQSTFPCIVHGDLWVNNIMIKRNSAGRPIALKFLDFQQSHRGNIYEDLVYFIYTSSTPDFRKEYLYTVLNTYYDTFVKTLKDVECPLPLGFSRGSLINTFNEEMLGGYVHTTFSIPLQLEEPIDDETKAKDMEEMMKAMGPGGPPDVSSMPFEAILEMVIQKMRMDAAKHKRQFLKSPRAVDRLAGITREMIDLKIL